MQVMLRPDQEAFVRRQIATGSYGNAEEVVEEALRLLEDAAKLQYLRAAVAKAREQVARGDYVEWTPDFWEKLQEEADEEDRLGLPIGNDVTP
jgi:antitoxin ParD1/3/4